MVRGRGTVPIGGGNGGGSNGGGGNDGGGGSGGNGGNSGGTSGSGNDSGNSGNGGGGTPNPRNNDVEEETQFSEIVQHLLTVCGIPNDSIMAQIIEQEGWLTVVDITMHNMKDIADFKLNTLPHPTKPLKTHMMKVQGFILLYKRMCRDWGSVFTERDVLNRIGSAEYGEYMSGEEYQTDRVTYGEDTPPPLVTSSSTAAMVQDKDGMTAAEFRRGVKRDKTHYEDLKDDKYFNTWDRNFIATAHMHHTELILDAHYVPKTLNEKAVFKEIQTFMYAVLEDHLKNDKGKSLVSKYEATRDAQSIYRELKEHALKSTAAQISGDMLLTYITTFRFPGSWRGTAYNFVLHWQEQILKYEKIEPSGLGPKPKLRMLQNAVADCKELAYVKQIADQDVARGSAPLTYEGYVQLLLSACSTYDRRYKEPSKQKRSVYVTDVGDYGNEDLEDYDPGYDDQDPFQVDTDVTEIFAYNTNLKRFGSKNTTPRDATGSQSLQRLPREEWMKLTPAQRDAFLEKRRKERMGNNSGNSQGTSMQRRVQFHDVEDTVNVDDLIDYAVNKHHQSSDEIGKNSEDNATLLAHMAGQLQPGAGDIREVLAAKRNPVTGKARQATEAATGTSNLKANTVTYHINKGETVEYQGRQYIANVTVLHYHVGRHNVVQADKALVDRGANGGVVGDDMLVVEDSSRFVDVSGLAGHKVSQLPIVTAHALIPTHKGDVIATFHQMAHLGKGKSILSCIQMEHYGAKINDKSSIVPGGMQRILMDGYQIPLDINQGLAYLRCRKPTMEELSTLPHVIMTSDLEWDPSVLDSNTDDMEKFYDAQEEEVQDSPFDQYGEYRYRTVEQHDTELTDTESQHLKPKLYGSALEVQTIALIHDERVAFAVDQSKSKVDFNRLRPLFGWFPADLIKRTFDRTTRFARGSMSDTLKMHWRTRFPACNVKRRNEAVATDTVFSDTPAVDCGVTCAQIFVGRESYVADVYPVKTDGEFVNALEDNIRERGAMDKLISDSAKAETSNRVKDILRALCICAWQSEAHYHHQNFAEIRYASIKQATNRVLNFSGAPAATWLLALSYVCVLMNHLASPALDYKPPLQVLTGQTPDISKFMQFSFYEPIYYYVYDDKFPSKPKEAQGWWVGIAETVGDALTYKVLTQCNKVIYRSAVRSAMDPAKRNLRLSPLGGETDINHQGDKVFIRSRFDEADYDLPDAEFLEPVDKKPNVKRQMVTIDPKDLIGRTFLKETEEDGQRFRARIVRVIEDQRNELESRPEYIKFLCEVPNSQDEIITYNQVLDLIEKEDNDEKNDVEQIWSFRKISGHQGPLKKGDKDWKGSSYNVLVEWETGETTFEPVDLIAADDPVSVADYALEQGLINRPGWKRYKKNVTHEKIRQRMVNKAKFSPLRHLPFWKFSFLVPRTHQQAMELDRKNGNNKWKLAEDTELQQILDYQTFIDKGIGGEAPPDYKLIRCRVIYDVKHDGRHKARIVAGGHLTDPNTESVYSGVVSLRGIRLIIFLAELNGLTIWAADVGNAYLEAKTKEKVYIIAGPEFGALEGHTLIIDRALYGLRSSGLCWHERFADVLREMGFVQSKAEADIWMRENNGIYEYIAVYVDDLLIAAKDPQKIVQTLQEIHGFKLKGVGPLTYHLGCDYARDKEDNVLYFGPKKYIKKMLDQYEKMFGTKAKEYTSPLEKGDHPEIDSTDELDEEGIKKYQTMIGCLQWAVSLGRFDIQTATMTMSRFRVAPRKGHLDRLKRIYGYLRRFSEAAIRVRTAEPDFSSLPEQEFDWCQTVYGNVQEIVPKDAPKPLGKEVVTITYVDANLYHDMLTGRAVTGILHFVNQTLIDSYSKRQATVETATFGSEFTAARIAVDQIIDLRNTLRYLGVPVKRKSVMFGDNQSVVTNSTIPHSNLNKRHNALAYHRVREMIAAKILAYYWINGSNNPADIVSKHWGYQQVYKLIRPILFYPGNTGDLIAREDVDSALKASEDQVSESS